MTHPTENAALPLHDLLIPTPRSLTAGDGGPLVVGDRLRLSSPHAGLATVTPLVVDLLRAEGVTLVDAEPDDAIGPATLGLELRPDADGGANRTQDSEAYALSVSDRGISITAASPAGIFYGAQTLAQFLSSGRGGARSIPALHIHDAPRFRYRGAMLDVARHFFDVDTVKSYIDRIALAKLNHLHLHLSDDQGWRLHIDSWPRLTERGSSGAVGGGAGGFYTHDDYREIVAYAAERFVTVVPEIDLPGHTHAAIVAYPELAPPLYAGAPDSAERPEDDTPAPEFAPYGGVEVGFSTVDTRSDVVHRFVADVTREIAALTPGPYLHLGGDESLSTSEEDYLDFLARASAAASTTGKTLVFWHEAGASAELPPGTIGQYWDYLIPRGRSADQTRRFVENAGAVILSPADAIYVDMKHADDDPLGLVWADGPTNVETSYSWEPDEVIAGLSPDAILGIEAPLWSETIESLADIDALAFPRLLAAAEIAWSPRPSESPERTWSSFRRRLVGWQPRLDALGIGYTRAEGVDWS
ncbi:hexosaminidase [Labedella gwakjiensis]|uniref:beta-N-acetylhexosaminidase n=1 Tax=Labedella gwakjiensis TaxID=390269 RepID=A0A2P8GRQ9_9MICO|nr:family 20 glycosylhydrolase [Labedella gwakjiensis]PSL36647.1 hexosaminidase [Labedella gwakjiensis]RUQ84170.1 beta-N-acetylhexosaminidase [Labedella gwakjiensis]